MYHFLKPCENSICSPESGGVSSAECFSDIEPFVRSKLNLTDEKSCSSVSATESCHGSPFGMTSKALTPDRGGDSSMSSAAGSLVKTSASPEMGQDLKANEAAFGENSIEWFAKLDLESCSWKIRQLWLFEDLDASLAIWPKSGMMLAGMCLEAPMPELVMSGPGFSFSLPTICKTESKDITRPKSLSSKDRGGRVARRICSTFWKTHCEEIVSLNPSFAEWMMGWPVDWTAAISLTDSKQLATAKFQSWLLLHGEP